MRAVASSPLFLRGLTPLAAGVQIRGMRWFLAAVIVLGLFALDRAYMDGQNAAFIASLAQRGAAAINNWAGDLVRSIRR